VFSEELCSSVCALNLSTDHCSVLFKTEVAISVGIILSPKLLDGL
jgi:hypothetical protein